MGNLTGRLGVATVLAATALTAAMTTGAAAAPAGSYAVVGHRGFISPTITENTIASFAHAQDAGATAIEFDISLTSDHRFLVMHDDTLKRTTTCTGKVSAWTLDDVQAQCRGQEGDESIPGLDDLLDWAQGRALNLIIEIKQHTGDKWTDEDFLAIAQAVSNHALTDRVIYMSLSDKHLLSIKEVVPGARVQAIADTWDAVREQRKWADGINVYAGDLNAKKVKALHDEGIVVLGRNTRVRSDWQRLLNAGADGILVDDTDAYGTWLQTAKKKG